MRDLILKHRADAFLTVMALVWGLHFIVLKDAFNDVDALTFNALRFQLGLPLILWIVWRNGLWSSLPTRRDQLMVLLTTIVGPLGYQVCLALGLDRTTSTNSALLVATMPVWTSLISLFTGLVMLRAQLIIGLAAALCGVVLVILSRGGANLSLSHEDLIGSLIILTGAMLNATSSILSKPLVDRMGGMRLASMKYVVNVTGLTLIASPGLLSLSPGDIPISNLPHLFFSGVISGVGGFVAINYGLQAIGPTRTMSYFNFSPIIAAVAGVLILDEPFSVLLLVGGALTLSGVTFVRRNTYKREPSHAHS